MTTQQVAIITNLINFLYDYKKNNPKASKQQIGNVVVKRFNLIKQRSVYSGELLSIRFSAANEGSFSNVVLSLSTLKHYDRLPFIICIVKPASLEFLLANSTFLKKISHSSHQLRIDNVRGSFLGHDIMRIYDGIPNSPENFDKLFSIHTEFSWEENLERLVESTGNIIPHGIIFKPTQEEIQKIFNSFEIAKNVIFREDYLATKKKVVGLIQDKEEAILRVAHIDNVNERGNFIEQIITGKGNAHSFEDMTYTLSDGLKIMIEIKTIRLDKSSCPKAYNIDKMLRNLSEGNVICVFCFLGIDLTNKQIHVNMVSIFDKVILGGTRIQFHWAGRNSRGVTQLTGDFCSVFSSAFKENIDIPQAKQFIQQLINIKK